MVKKLLLCAALIASCINLNAQSWKSIFPQATAVKSVQEIEPNQNVSATTSKTVLKDNECWIGYCDDSDEVGGMGVKNPAKFDCAIKITKDLSDYFKSARLKAIRIQMSSVNYTSNFKVWIKKNINDASPLVEQDITVDSNLKWCEFPLNTPYEITGEEFFIGYSFELTNVGNEQDGYPIGILPNVHPEGLYLQFDNQGWNNHYSQGIGTLAIQGLVEHPTGFHSTNVELISASSLLAMKNTQTETTVKFLNLGSEPIRNLTVEYTLDSKAETYTTPNFPAVDMMKEGSFKLPVVAPSEPAEKALEIKAIKVNGKEDPFMDNNATTGFITVLSKLAKHKVLIEEGTATSCGFCPRGAVGMKLIKEKLSDKAVGIAVHSGDFLECRDYRPLINQIPGLPTAVLDRIYFADPYYGSNQKDFGIADLIEMIAAMPTVADINVSGEINPSNENNKVNLDVESNVTFHSSIKSFKYTVAYAVIENGLTGSQKSYYYGDRNLPPNLAYLANLPSPIRNFPFNEVARRLYSFAGIPNSLAGEIKDGVTKNHSYTFKLRSSEYKKLENLEVVAMLMDPYGRVVNCNVSPVKINSTGINKNTDNFKPQVTNKYGMLHIEGEGQMKVEVYTAEGVLVTTDVFDSTLSLGLNGLQGIHLVRITKGNDVFMSKIIL